MSWTLSCKYKLFRPSHWKSIFEFVFLLSINVSYWKRLCKSQLSVSQNFVSRSTLSRWVNFLWHLNPKMWLQTISSRVRFYWLLSFCRNLSPLLLGWLHSGAGSGVRAALATLFGGSSGVSTQTEKPSVATPRCLDTRNLKTEAWDVGGSSACRDMRFHMTGKWWRATLCTWMPTGGWVRDRDLACDVVQKDLRVTILTLFSYFVTRTLITKAFVASKQHSLRTFLFLIS